MAEQPSHLLAKAAAYLVRRDEERITYIRSPRWIGYDSANDILERLEALLVHPKSHRMPNLLIVGDTNNGKTMLVRRFCSRHPPDDNKDGNNINVPVLFVQAPPIPDEGRFYNAILEQLFAPYKPGDRVDRKQFQAIKLMRQVGLRMLIIDEIHHILAGSFGRQRAFLNVLKFLGNELEIPIVAIGTRDAFRAIQTDPQLANRFDHAALPRWRNDDDFVRLLMTFERMIPLRHPSVLDDPAVVDRIYAMSDGYIGEISRLLEEAAVAAIKTGKEMIDRQILDSISWVSPSDRRKQPEVL
ncbi:TniB family NTP-binding protein [Azonexus fungiphilus]|uniref:TniB family NTP-binding protein n=1 Tax=Azonexus fungiphilus TaxID=146940 RepID=UPI00156ADBF7|nr:TniB family NTP-binding protein [Azonexus fungiphilus]NHC06406.1 AAA family ATPase [Azonexus fungiphilus]